MAPQLRALDLRGKPQDDVDLAEIVMSQGWPVEEWPNGEPAEDEPLYISSTVGVDPQNVPSWGDTQIVRFGLPLITSNFELANWLHIPRSRLSWFTHDRSEEFVWHYVRYEMPKRDGSTRVILAPKRALKSLQRHVLQGMLTKAIVALSRDSAHGFIPGRSIMSNARPHVGQRIVLRVDIKGFFQSIDVKKVRQVFLRLDYPFPVAATLALLCTEYDRAVESNDDGERHFVSRGERTLPQGAPTSPALANLYLGYVCSLDSELEELAKEASLAYTRYADDLTFSGQYINIPKFLSRVRAALKKSGFYINRTKTYVTRNCARQVVTGLVVNDRVAAPRALRRRMRAILYNARATGLDAQNRAGHRNFAAHLQGQIAYIASAHPDHAEALRAELARLRWRATPHQAGT